MRSVAVAQEQTNRAQSLETEPHKSLNTWNVTEVSAAHWGKDDICNKCIYQASIWGLN